MNNKKKGFSLVELLIALVILGFVIAGAVQLLGMGSGLMASQASSAARLNTERFTLDGIYNELREGSVASVKILSTDDPLAEEDYKYIFLRRDGKAILRDISGDFPLIGAEGIGKLNFSIPKASTNSTDYMLSISVVAAQVNQGEKSREAKRSVGLSTLVEKDPGSSLDVGTYTGNAIQFAAFVPPGEEKPAARISGDVYHVALKRRGLGDGSTWANAKEGTAANLNALMLATAKTITVRVPKTYKADGTVKDWQTVTITNPDSGKQIWMETAEYKLTANLNLMDGAQLYGGFTGKEVVYEDINKRYEERDNRDLSEGKLTVLDLNLKKIVGDGKDATNAGCNDVRIDGFLIKNGKGDGKGVMHLCDHDRVLSSPSKITIANCIFTNNVADGGTIGACCYIYLTIENCAFRNNTSKYGAVSTCPKDYPIFLTITNSTFSGNKATESGAAIYLPKMSKGTSTAIIKNSTFYGNTAKVGGAIFNGASMDITNSTFSANTATTTGGGLHSAEGTLNMRNSTFSGNVATTNGGGMYIVKDTANVTNCTFSDNKANGTGGGGMYVADGTTNIINSIIWGNTGATGKGIWQANHKVDIEHSGTITTVVASGDWNNNFNGNKIPIAGNPNLVSVDRKGNTATASVDVYIYKLLSGSSALNTGTTTGAPTTDQRGVARSGLTDIGAYEYNLSVDIWPKSKDLYP